MPVKFSDFIKQQLVTNFDTFAIAFAFLFTCGMTLHLAHHDMDKNLVDWSKQLVTGFSGALLLRLNGRKNTDPSQEIKKDG